MYFLKKIPFKKRGEIQNRYYDPRNSFLDRRAWRAAVHGVAKSRTQKWLDNNNKRRMIPMSKGKAFFLFPSLNSSYHSFLLPLWTWFNPQRRTTSQYLNTPLPAETFISVINKCWNSDTADYKHLTFILKQVVCNYHSILSFLPPTLLPCTHFVCLTNLIYANWNLTYFSRLSLRLIFPIKPSLAC